MDSCTTDCSRLIFWKVIKTTYPAGYSESSAYSNLNLNIATSKKITAITKSIPTSLLQSPRSPDRNTAGLKIQAVRLVENRTPAKLVCKNIYLKSRWQVDGAKGAGINGWLMAGFIYPFQKIG